MDGVAADPGDPVEEGGGLMEFRNRFFDELLRSDGVRAVVDDATKRIADKARSTAPVGETSDYKNGITTGSKLQERYVGLVQATDPKSMIIEARTGNLARAVRGSGRGR